MIITVIKHIKTACSLLAILTMLTGLIYPSVVTGLAQLLFPWQANGSFVEKEGKPIGSLLIGQNFTDEKYFWGRPSATTPFPYNAGYSCGSNSGSRTPNFLNGVKQRVAYLQKVDLQNHLLIPVDLVTASASGLDPEISPMAAYYQVRRIAKVRKISEREIAVLVQHSIIERPLKLLGEPRVNVLLLNLALDNI